MSQISLENLLQADLCVGTGIYDAGEGKLNMKWDNKGFLIPDLDSNCNKTTIRLSPFNPDPEDDVKDEDKIAEIFLTDAVNFHPRIGKYIDIYAGHVPEYRLTSSSGGIGTYIFKELLRRRIVDHVFTVVEKNGNYAYEWVNNIEDIRQISKTRYYPVTLERLFKELHTKEGKIAVSAIPSFIKAIRLWQYYYPEIKDKIVFIEGIICGGIKSRFFTDYLAQKSGIEGKYNNAEYRIKDTNSTATDYSFGAFDQQQKLHSIKMRKVGNMWGTGLFNANAYDFSTDVTAELGDVSIGDAWMEPYKSNGAGNNVIVCRSEVANTIIREGIDKGDLILDEIGIEKFLKSQAGGIRHMQKAIQYRLKRQKKKYGIVPYVRPRMLESIPWEFKIVQRIRMNLREKSLKEWRNNPNSKVFDKAIQKDLIMLKVFTLVYHKVQKIRRKLGMKTL